MNVALSIAEMLADNMNIVECTRGNRHHVAIGALANFGDEQVRTELLGRMRSEGGFDSALFEVICVASQQRQGHDAQKIPGEGQPDLRITIPGLELPIVAECKFASGMGKSTVRTALSTANKQLREAGVRERDARVIGLVYLEISNRVGNVQSNGDGPPDAVSAAMADVKRLLANPARNRSISAVAVMWKEKFVNEQTTTALVLWRSRLFRHRAPHVSLPEGTVKDSAIAFTQIAGMQYVANVRAA